jgi:hypothetical protein
MSDRGNHIGPAASRILELYFKARSSAEAFRNRESQVALATRTGYEVGIDGGNAYNLCQGRNQVLPSKIKMFHALLSSNPPAMSRYVGLYVLLLYRWSSS